MKVLAATFPGNFAGRKPGEVLRQIFAVFLPLSANNFT